MKIEVKQSLVVNGIEFNIGDSVEIKIKKEVRDWGYVKGKILKLNSPVENMFEFQPDDERVYWSLYYEDLEDIRKA